jgi:hypothetical protein
MGLLVCRCAIDIGDYTRRFWSFLRVSVGDTIQRLDWIRFYSILLEVEMRETMMLGEVVRYSALTSADSWEFLAEGKFMGSEDVFTSAQTNQHFATLSR